MVFVGKKRQADKTRQICKFDTDDDSAPWRSRSRSGVSILATSHEAWEEWTTHLAIPTHFSESRLSTPQPACNRLPDRAWDTGRAPNSDWPWSRSRSRRDGHGVLISATYLEGPMSLLCILCSYNCTVLCLSIHFW
jgi:hypothetical protein